MITLTSRIESCCLQVERREWLYSVESASNLHRCVYSDAKLTSASLSFHHYSSSFSHLPLVWSISLQFVHTVEETLVDDELFRDLKQRKQVLSQWWHRTTHTWGASNNLPKKRKNLNIVLLSLVL